MKFVPVVDINQKPLMPTTANRAASWIKSGKATPFWKRGIFCVRLNVDPSGDTKQDIALGIDPGSKKEGYTAKSAAHTFLNIQADAVTWVKDAMSIRRDMRRTRRCRNTPCRAKRANRSFGRDLPPSTKARWAWKLRISVWLSKIYPIRAFVVEDIVAKTRPGHHGWNRSFGPLQVGKRWFYAQLAKLGTLETKEGWETKKLRDSYGLGKSNNKMAEVFSAHCVDSWVLANWFTGGHIEPDNKSMLVVIPLRFHRRQLHKFQFERGGMRKLYGGTKSQGFVRGSLVEHDKYGLTYIGGSSDRGISLHSVETSERVCRTAKPTNLKFKTYSTWRTRKASSGSTVYGSFPKKRLY